MKSFLLQQLGRVILPFAVLLGLALLLKGHDAPGGGFVAGLSFAVAGIFGFTAYGARRFHASVPVEPERVALLGGLLLLAGVIAPLALGEPGLTQWNGRIQLGPLAFKWQTVLLFELGVVLTVGGALAAAALWLWETSSRTREER